MDTLQNTIQLIASLLFLTILLVWLAKYIKDIALAKQEKNEASTIGIHLMYVCFIAALVIVSLVTYICIGNTSSDTIMSYISFASTLSSLILSVVAIIYTIVLSKSGAEQNTKINEAIITLQNSIKDFQEKSKKLDSIAERLANVEVTAKETNEKVSKIVVPDNESGKVNQGSMTTSAAN